MPPLPAEPRPQGMVLVLSPSYLTSSTPELQVSKWRIKAASSASDIGG